MKITLKYKTFDLHYSMRGYILYENIMGKSMSFDDKYSYTSLLVLLYSFIVGTIQRDKLGITLSYDEFIDYVDDNDPQKLLKEFSEWFTSQLNFNSDLKDVTNEEIEEVKETGKKS